MCIGIFVFLPVLIFLPMMGLELFAPKDSLEHGKLYAWSFNAINLLLLFLTLQLWQSAQREPDRRSPGANEQEENVNPEFH